MPSVNEELRWKRNPAVLWRSSLDGIVLSLPGELEPVGLTKGGRAVWDRLAEPVPFDVLVDDLAVAHDAEVEAVRSDVRALIEFLASNGGIISASTNAPLPTDCGAFNRRPSSASAAQRDPANSPITSGSLVGRTQRLSSGVDAICQAT